MKALKLVQGVLLAVAVDWYMYRIKTTEEDSGWGSLPLFLYSVAARDRIAENSELGRAEGEDNKCKRDQTKDPERKPRGTGSTTVGCELTRFKDIRDRRRDEEDRNIYPVGRAADNTVVGVKDHRDQQKSEQDSS